MRRTDLTLTVFAALILGGLVVWAYIHRAMIAVLSPHGPIALAERTVILETVGLAAIVVVPVFFFLFFFAWKYRDTHPFAPVHHEPNWDHDSPISETLWWLVPGIIIFILGIIAWQSSHALDPYVPLANNELEVQVVALDWKWLFLYPTQGVASVNMLEIPAHVPVRFDLTADAPMNSFWIPSLGGQIMVMPGMSTQLNLEADTTGTYDGYSANISGAGFAGMAFKVHAVSLDAFNAWVSAVQASSSPLTVSQYRVLAKPSEYNLPTTYRLSDPTLYDSITMSYMAKAPASSSMPTSEHTP